MEALGGEGDDFPAVLDFFLIDLTVTVLHSEDRNTPQKSLVRSQRLLFCIIFDSIVFIWYPEWNGLSPYSPVKDVRKCDRQAYPFDILGGSAGSRTGTSKLTLQESLMHLRWRHCALCSLCRIYEKIMWDLYICGNKTCSLEVISKRASNPSLCPDNFIFNNSHTSSFIFVLISSSDHYHSFFSD